MRRARFADDEYLRRGERGKAKLTANSITRRCAVSIFILVLSGHSLAFARTASGENDLDIVLERLGPVLKSSRKAARLYYVNSLRTEGDIIPYCEFPDITINSPSPESVGEDAVTEIFRGNPNVRVFENKSGIISIIVNEPSLEILRTKIRSIKLSEEERYDAGRAVDAIDVAPEIKTARQKLEIKETRLPTFGAVIGPNEAYPHLPKHLRNLSMDRAFDLVASTFGTTVIYGECFSPAQYTVRTSGAAWVYDDVIGN